MIQVQEIINRIKETSGYKDVDWLMEKEDDLIESFPRIRVGYHSIIPVFPNHDLSDGIFRENNEDLKQFFIIQIDSEVKKYFEVWERIFGTDNGEIKLIGWTPTIIEQNTSPINFISDTVIGLSQGKQKTQILIACAFPTFVP